MSNTSTPLDEVYLFQLERAVRQFRHYAMEEMTKHGLAVSGEHWVVLKRAYEKPGMLQKDIAASTYKDPASLTRILDLLEKQQLIRRQRSSVDRRAMEVYLTIDGMKFVEKGLPIAVEIRKKGLDGFSKREQRMLSDFLDRIYDNFQ